MSERLAALAHRHDLADVAVARLAALLEILAVDPRAPTAVRDPRRAIDVHLADSLVALELCCVRRACAIADLGAGAGFPGLALAAALPAARVALVESAGRKCAFLARALAAAAVENATVIAGRVEDWRDGLAACDLVTARAVAALPVVLEYAAPLLAPRGHVVAWKGRRDRGEETAGGRAAATLGLEPVEVRAVQPYAAAEHRHLHVFAKTGTTLDRFPRRAGMARKRPLGG